MLNCRGELRDCFAIARNDGYTGVIARNGVTKQTTGIPRDCFAIARNDRYTGVIARNEVTKQSTRTGIARPDFDVYPRSQR